MSTEHISPQYPWIPPQFNTSQAPSLYGSLVLTSDSNFPHNFPRTAKWSPDGSVLLSQCENRSFQFFETAEKADESGIIKFQYPVEASQSYTIHLGSWRPSPDGLKPSCVISQPAPILDFLWYPTATPRNPASFCFLSSVREHPVKLLDASDGRLRASYRIVDHRERQISPHSLSFNLTAEKLYCGFEDAIEVFDVVRPGEGVRLHTSPSKKSKDGLKGIVSTLAFCPSYSSDPFYAAGSLSPTPSNIALFSENQGEIPLMFVSGGPSAGVTQVHFNPTQPHLLYASYRRHGSIYSWDIRSNVDTPILRYNCTSQPITNQKLRFDVDSSGRWLGVGDQKGKISVFDLSSHAVGTESLNSEIGNLVRSPTLEFNAQKDTVGSVAFHPLQPLLVSVSGSRHFLASGNVVDSEDEDEDEVQGGHKTPDHTLDSAHITRFRTRPYPVAYDSSIKIWDFASPASS